MRAVKPFRRLLPLAAGLVCVAAFGAETDPKAYRLPLASATEWQIVVFAARVPAALQEKPVAFTLKAAWQTPAGAEAKELSGSVAFLKITRLPLSVPAGCSALTVTLDWPNAQVDLDLGLECAAPVLRLAPVLTVLKPERVRFDAQTAPFYEWLTAQHPDWWRGYPFWAEVKAAPRAPGGRASR